MSMITATAWVPRGFAAPFPTKYEIDEVEFQRIAELAKLQLEDAIEDLDDARKTAADNDADAVAKDEDDDEDGDSAAKGRKSQTYVSCIGKVVY